VKITSLVSALALVVAGGLAATGAEARDQIRVVGSSTVYPFTTTVAEQFGRAGKFKTPVVESTGTGGGFKLFCAGVGPDHPDLTNASRPISKTEREDCVKNGVTDIVEIEVGFDGIVLANSKKGPDFKITKGQVFLALAKEVPGADGKLIANPYKKWNEIDASLPNEPIEVLGPPPTSGTRDAFLELVMDLGAREIPAMADLRKADAKAFEKVFKTIREDGAYIDAGENDNVIVQKLEANPEAVGIFGFSFLEENTAKVKGAIVGGVEPTFENIAAGKYKVSRSLFVYLKKQHVGVIPGLKEFAEEYVSKKAMGDGGYLEAKGLIPLPAAKYDAVVATVKDLKALTN
jgi:phosphate transport system substrate-binding protein